MAALFARRHSLFGLALWDPFLEKQSLNHRGVLI